jgi:hypothetical protein
MSAVIETNIGVDPDDRFLSARTRQTNNALANAASAVFFITDIDALRFSSAD